MFLLCYEGCSYFTTLDHNVRGRYWWYASKSWTFPPIICYILLLCDKWQQRSDMINMRQTWKFIWSKGLPLNSSVWKKMAPTDIIDACWTVMETNQWMRAQWRGGWCVSAETVATVGNLCWCRLGLVMVVTILKQCFVAEIFLYQTVLFCSLYLL